MAVKAKEIKYFILTCDDCGATIEVNEIKSEYKGWQIHSNTFPARADTITKVRCGDCVDNYHKALLKSKSLEDRIKSNYYEHKNFWNDFADENNLSIEQMKVLRNFYEMVIGHDSLFKTYNDLFEIMNFVEKWKQNV